MRCRFLLPDTKEFLHVICPIIYIMLSCGCFIRINDGSYL